MSYVPIGLILLFLFAPLILTEIWLIYMIHRFTEKAESFLPKSTFVEANRAAYSQAGFIGKGMRNGFLTLVLMIPGPCAKRGIVDIAEAKNFPKDLKRILFVSWGLCFVFFISLMVFGLYLRCTDQPTLS
jgi:amino acid transporter